MPETLGACVPYAGMIPSPGEPTEAPPGTCWKIAVLAARASRRESLFHPRDNPVLDHAPAGQAGGGMTLQARLANRALPAGVYWDARKRKYRARTWDPATKTKRSLGLYETAELAAAAIKREKPPEPGTTTQQH